MCDATCTAHTCWGRTAAFGSAHRNGPLYDGRCWVSGTGVSPMHLCARVEVGGGVCAFALCMLRSLAALQSSQARNTTWLPFVSLSPCPLIAPVTRTRAHTRVHFRHAPLLHRNCLHSCWMNRICGRGFSRHDDRTRSARVHATTTTPCMHSFVQKRTRAAIQSAPAPHTTLCPSRAHCI